MQLQQHAQVIDSVLAKAPVPRSEDEKALSSLQTLVHTCAQMAGEIEDLNRLKEILRERGILEEIEEEMTATEETQED